MMEAVVAITRRIPEAGIRLLEGRFRINLFDSDDPPGRRRLFELLSGADAAITLLSDKIDDELLAACPKLKVLANHAVGYENIDVEAAARRGIWVTNTPEVLTEATADLAMALILAVARRIVEADAFMRAGKYTSWQPKLLRGRSLSGKTLGVFGFGRIGQAVARRAGAFGMNIVYTDPTPRPDAERDLAAKRVQFDELLAVSDVLTIHSPYLPELRYVMNAEAFAAMKPTAIFINTARGALMDEKALVNALKTGGIAGAGLDVYEREPNFEPELAGMDNIVMLPHIGSATLETRDAMAELAARNVAAVLDGLEPLTPVNKPRERK
jgi:glyoxylate reductase